MHFSSQSQKTNRLLSRPAVILFTLAFSVRILVMLLAMAKPDNFLKPDSHDYLRLAKALVNTGIYGTSTQPEIFRAPGYPLFLSLFQATLGNSVIPVVIIQLIFSSLTVVLLWQTLKNLFPGKSEKLYFFVCIFQVIAIPSIVSSCLLLSETLFTFFLTLTICLFSFLTAHHNSQGNHRYIQLIGLALATICMYFLRTIALPLIPFFVIMFWLFSRKTKPALCYLLLCLIPGMIWSARNYHEANYTGFSSVGSINLYRYYASALVAHRSNRSYFNVISEHSRNIFSHPSQTEQAAFAKQQGIAIIKKSFLRYCFIHLKSNSRTLLPAMGDLYQLFGVKIGGSGTLGVIQSQGIFAGIKHYFAGKWHLFFLALPFAAILMLKYFLSGFGILLMLLKKKSVIFTKHLLTDKELLFFLFTLILFCYFLFIPGPVSTPRFRVPVTPLLSIFVFYFISCLPLLKHYLPENFARKFFPNDQQ